MLDVFFIFCSSAILPTLPAERTPPLSRLHPANGALLHDWRCNFDYCSRRQFFSRATIAREALEAIRSSDLHSMGLRPGHAPVRFHSLAARLSRSRSRPTTALDRD